jgi:hypothetical protein
VKKVVSGGWDFGIIIAAKHGVRHGGAEFDAKECGAPTHHQYKTTLNLYEKAKPIGRPRKVPPCP